MSDITERLRDTGLHAAAEAADEIERLRDENMRLTVERETICQHSGVNEALQCAFERGQLYLNGAGYVTRAALGDQP